MTDKAIPQGLDGHLDHAQEEWLRLMPDGWDGTDYVAENASLRMERDFYFRQVEENAKRSQAAYESLGDENDKLDQKRITLLHKVYQLNDVIRRQRKQLTDVQDAMRKRNEDNKRLKQVSEKLFRMVNHFCVKGYPCISCPLFREEAPCELVKSYFALKELGCDVRIG